MWDGTTSADIPTTLQPLILAIWPTADPTAPAAPVTTRVSPGFGLHNFKKPKYDVALLQEGGKESWMGLY